MNIDELSYGQMKEIAKAVGKTFNEDHPYKIGQAYLIRTVTMYVTGRLTWVGDKELVVEDAAWIADTGRYADALKDPSVLKEIEPVPGPKIIGRGAIIDVDEWNHPLPKVQK